GLDRYFVYLCSGLHHRLYSGILGLCCLELLLLSLPALRRTLGSTLLSPLGRGLCDSDSYLGLTHQLGSLGLHNRSCGRCGLWEDLTVSSRLLDQLPGGSSSPQCVVNLHGVVNQREQLAEDLLGHVVDFFTEPFIVDTPDIVRDLQSL